MPRFFVHWNRIRRRVRIHHADCGACNHGEGMHRGRIAAGRGDTYDWVGIDTYTEASNTAHAIALRINANLGDCGMCNPHLGTSGLSEN